VAGFSEDVLIGVLTKPPQRVENIVQAHVQKRVYLLYREEGLAMRIRQRRRIRWNGAVVKPAASQPNERWSMDFVTDCVSSEKVIRMLTIADDCSRECPVIEVDISLGGLRVRRVLDRIAIRGTSYPRDKISCTSLAF
jgi:transposase InsO family protein